MENLLPYLNVLEADTITRDNVTKALVIDKDDNIALLNGEDLGTNNYQDLQNKPEINGVSLNGNLTASELGLASTSDIPTKISQLTNDSGYITSLDGYATEEWVNSQGFATNESVTEGLAGKQDELVKGNGINISGNTISADYSSIDNKPSLNGKTLEASTNIVPAIQVQAIPTKLTITPSLGNQTGQAVELPGYDTSTNASGILTSQVFGILNDKYTKEEIDNINSAINTAISKKQDKLTAGANIRIVDNVISAFNNHLFLHLDENDTEHQAYVYSFIKSNLEFYLFAEITYEGKVVVLPLVAIENNESLDLKGIYLKDDSTIVEVSAVLVANGNISVNTSEINLNAGSSDYNNLTNKPQINSVELSGNKTLAALGIQAAGNYALKSDIPTKVSELTNDSNFVTEAEVSGDLAGKADKTYVDEQLATKQPVGDYATKTELAGKADSSMVESLSTQVATNTSDISIIKTKQEEDGNKIDSLDKEMATKQDLLVSGTNIKTINSQSLLGEGNIEIESGSNIPFLFINSTTHLSGDFAAVKNAIANKTPFELYYVNILGYGDVAAPEVCFVSGENIQATFHFESTTTNHTVVQTTITPTGVSADTSYHSYQEQLVSGTNIKTINGESILGEGNLEISGSGGTNDYTQLTNKPQINSVELSGNKSLSDLGIQPAGNYIEAGTGTQPQINTITVLTQSEYDGLSTKDPNTQYLIVE